MLPQQNLTQDVGSKVAGAKSYDEQIPRQYENEWKIRLQKMQQIIHKIQNNINILQNR